MQTTPHGYFILFAYAVLFIGVLITGIGWLAFKIRALRNRPAWDGIGGKLIKRGLGLVALGLILLAVALYLLGHH